MKKIIISIVILIITIPLIGVNIKNNKNYYLETITNTYTKEEIDNKLNELKTSIETNKSNIEANKNILTTIQNKLSEYALKTKLNKTNSNVDSLNSIVKSNETKITNLENLFKEGNATSSDILNGKTAIVNGNKITGTLDIKPGRQEITLKAGFAYINSTSSTATTLTIPNMGWTKITRKTSNNVQYFWINGDRTLTSDNNSLDISSITDISFYLQGISSNPGKECSITFILE